MKNFIFALCAGVAGVLCVSCERNSEATFDLASVETATEATLCHTFADDNEEALAGVCREIIDVHKDIFADATPSELLLPVLQPNYSLDAAVAVIAFWYNDDKCGDVLCEWCDIDEFFALLPQRYYDIYHFCV